MSPGSASKSSSPEHTGTPVFGADARRSGSGPVSAAAGRNSGRRRSEDSRRAILAATLSLLEEKGLNDLSIEAVAARAGVGKSTIYRWWPSRTALTLDAVEELAALTVPDTGSLAGDLRALLTELRGLLWTTPLGAILGHIASERATIDPLVRDYVDRRIGPVAEVVRRAVERGQLPADTNVDDVVYLATGPVVTRTLFDTAVPDDGFIDVVVRNATATGAR